MSLTHLLWVSITSVAYTIDILQEIIFLKTSLRIETITLCSNIRLFHFLKQALPWENMIDISILQRTSFAIDCLQLFWRQNVWTWPFNCFFNLLFCSSTTFNTVTHQCLGNTSIINKNVCMKSYETFLYQNTCLKRLRIIPYFCGIVENPSFL